MSFRVMFWNSRDPLGYTVSLPLRAGPITVFCVSNIYDKIRRFSSVVAPLYQLKRPVSLGRLWTCRRTSFPSVALGGTDSTVTWAVVGGFQRVKSKTRKEGSRRIRVWT